MKTGAGVAKSVSVVIMLAALAGLMSYQILQTPSPKASKLEKCADLLQGCKILSNGQTVSVKFSEPPQCIKAFYDYRKSARCAGSLCEFYDGGNGNGAD